MCSRGVWQLQRLTVRYCKHSGNSRGVRDFIRDRLVKFAEENPQLHVKAEVRHNAHPTLVGEYLNGTTKVIDVSRKARGEVVEAAYFLRNQTGRKVKKITAPVRSVAPSIQGIWDPATKFDKFGLRC